MQSIIHSPKRTSRSDSTVLLEPLHYMNESMKFDEKFVLPGILRVQIYQFIVIHYIFVSGFLEKMNFNIIFTPFSNHTKLLDEYEKLTQATTQKLLAKSILDDIMNKKKLFLQNICKYTKKVKQNQSEQISKKLLNTESQRNGMMIKKNTLKYHSRKHQQQNIEKQGGSLQENSAQFGLQNSRQYATNNNVGINNQLGKRNRVSNTFKYESEEEKTAGCLFRIHNYPKDKQGFQIPQKRIKSHQKQDQQSFQQDFSQGSNEENFNSSNLENQFQISPSQIRNNHNSDLLSHDFENLSLYKLRNQPRKPQSQQKFKFTKEIFAEFMLQRSMEKLKLIKDCDQDYYIRKLEADASHITNEVVKTLILNQAYSFHRDIKYVCKSLDYFKVPDMQVGSKSEMNYMENQLQCQINQYNTFRFNYQFYNGFQASQQNKLIQHQAKRINNYRQHQVYKEEIEGGALNYQYVIRNSENSMYSSIR